MNIREIKITDAEAAEVGVTQQTPPEVWRPLIVPLLVARGVPLGIALTETMCDVIRRDLDGNVFGVLGA